MSLKEPGGEGSNGDLNAEAHHEEEAQEPLGGVVAQEGAVHAGVQAVAKLHVEGKEAQEQEEAAEEGSHEHFAYGLADALGFGRKLK